MGRAVTEFNKTHPSICVTQEDVGAGSPEYVKIADALKAGSGAPDVAEVEVEVEFDELPSFEVTHNVVNLVPYGATKYKANFVPWAWKEASQGPAVYAMPGDAGPMAFYYNSTLLAKYHISPPATWAQFATAAAALKKADLSAHITNFPEGATGPGRSRAPRSAERRARSVCRDRGDGVQGEIAAATAASGVARVGPRATIRAHAPAVLSVDGERLYFFDPATGTAIS